ncbi:hypothetical protein ACG2LH_08030 [Zhouia sp. PK063]|uniref:hypothetical protein n=1 Tax=Zhouia sp. PK063 TaxID=3373602 RepID=UPI003790A7AC
MTTVEQHNNLNTFRILFLIKGILFFFIIILLFIYMGVGAVISQATIHDEAINHMPINPGIIFIIVGAVGVVFVLIFAILNILTAKYLNEHKNYNFITVIAILNCLSGILGILLGVFTLIELNKPEVKALFNKA